MAESRRFKEDLLKMFIDNLPDKNMIDKFCSNLSKGEKTGIKVVNDEKKAIQYTALCIVTEAGTYGRYTKNSIIEALHLMQSYEIINVVESLIIEKHIGYFQLNLLKHIDLSGFENIELVIKQSYIDKIDVENSVFEMSGNIIRFNECDFSNLKVCQVIDDEYNRSGFVWKYNGEPIVDFRSNNKIVVGLNDIGNKYVVEYIGGPHCKVGVDIDGTLFIEKLNEECLNVLVKTKNHVPSTSILLKTEDSGETSYNIAYLDDLNGVLSPTDRLDDLFKDKESGIYFLETKSIIGYYVCDTVDHVISFDEFLELTGQRR